MIANALELSDSERGSSMFRRARTSYLAAAILVSACRTSYYAEKGDERVLEANYPMAIIDYDHALNNERGLSEEEREQILAKRNDAIARYTDQVLSEVHHYVAGGQHDAAIQKLATLRASPLFQLHAPRERLRVALEEVAEQRWQTMVPHFAGHRYLGSVPLAEWIAAAVPDYFPIQNKLSLVRAEAANYHLQLASQSQLGARLIHLRAAQRFGATGHEAEIAALYIEVAKLAQINYLLSSEQLADPRCAPFFGRLRENLGGNKDGLAITLRVKLESCVHVEERWSEEEEFSYSEPAPYQETIEEQYYAPARDTCPEGQCLRYDALGVCVERKYADECTESGVVLRTRETEVTRFRTRTATLSAVVGKRRLASGVKGLFELVALEQQRSMVFDRILSIEEKEVWTPASSSRFSAVSLETLSLGVATEVGNLVRQQMTAFRTGLEHQRAVQATLALQKGMEREAEADFVVASLISNYPPAAASNHFVNRYGLHAEPMMQLLRGAMEPMPTAFYPINFGAVDQPDYRYLPVEETTARRGAEIRSGLGIDFYARTDSSPLDTSKWFQSAGIRFRLEGTVLSFEGRTPELAGDSSGLNISMRAVYGKIENLGVLFSAGFAWDHERSETNERRYFLGAPLSIIIPLGRVLSLEAQIDLNFFHLKKWTDDQPNDPHYYSPVSLRAEIDLDGRGYFAVVLRHYLGAGEDKLIDGGLELGLRL